MIFFAPRRRIAMPPQDQSITVGDRVVPVAIRRNARAKRLILRINLDGNGVTVTVLSGVRVDDAIAFVRGRTDWIADRLDSIQQPGRITMRDTRSRWGSCSATGNLSFSWRLVMAPEAVLAYVVAHEVAHLAERGHGPPF